MTHYFIDDQWNLIKGPLSVDEISKLANEYQDKYFPGQKPTVSIQVTNSPQFQGVGCYEPATKKIWLAERVTEFENTLKIALLHEMIHANMHARGFDARDQLLALRAHGTISRGAISAVFHIDPTL